MHTHNSESAVANDQGDSLPAPLTVNLCPLHPHFTKCPKALSHTLLQHAHIPLTASLFDDDIIHCFSTHSQSGDNSVTVL